MRLSQLYLPTLKEVPSEAELISHKLMLRAGLMRKLAAGIFSYLPLGVRVIRKVEEIVREEMVLAGAQEVILPILQPAELWRETGRWEIYGPTMMKLQDRHDRWFGLGPTHEEVITDLVRHEIRSYRDLPRNLFQIGTKFRDEIRPRFGVMRGREFVMKDGYSFHADASSLDETYQEMYAAYGKICERLGVDYAAVEADSGPIGGAQSHEFMILASSGEDITLSCTGCDYAANVERAETRQPAAAAAPPVAAGGKKVHTPGQTAVEEVSAFLKLTPMDMIKTMIYVGDGEPVVVLIRGDREINEVKVKNHLNVNELELADDDTIEKITNAPKGFAGPVGMTGVRIMADFTVSGMTNAGTGANEADYHLINVQPGDFKVDDWADFNTAIDGDACPRCAGQLIARRGIEMGHVFKLGTKYSEALGATFQNREGKPHPLLMGCYGIGITRIVAAVIEQHHDDKGIVWPLSLAPYLVHIVPLGKAGDDTMVAAEKLYADLQQAGIDALLDDRAVRAGVKFNDADLLGLPLRVNIGARSLAKGVVELKLRRADAIDEIEVASAVDTICATLREIRP